MSAPDDRTEGGHGPAQHVLDLPFHRQVAFFAFLALTVLGVLFYLGWGLAYGVWIDNGVYAVVITLLLFGLAGMWLMAPDPPVTGPLPGQH